MKQKNNKNKKQKELEARVKASGLRLIGQDMSFLNYGFSQFEDPFKEKNTVDGQIMTNSILSIL